MRIIIGTGNKKDGKRSQHANNKKNDPTHQFV
jgi:hypothetical protein